MVQGERLSAVAKRRRLNGDTASASPSPAPAPAPAPVLTSGPPKLHSLTSKTQPIDETNSFSALANNDTVQFSSTREVDIINERAVKIRLSRGQKCLVSGAYLIWVRKGTINLLGAVLRASDDKKDIHVVYAPETCDIPPITAISEPAEFQLDTIEGGLVDGLGFRRYEWPTHGNEVCLSRSFLVHGACPRESLQVKNNRDVDTDAVRPARKQLMAFNPLESMCSTPCIVLCGTRFPGISIHSLSLVNHLLTELDQQGNLRYPQGVLVLDLDLNVPDFGPPGTISLVHISKPVFRPCFTRLARSTSTTSGIPTECRILAMEYFGVSDDVEAEQLTFQNTIKRTKQELERLGTCPTVIKAWDWFDYMKTEAHEIIRTLLAPSHVFSLRSAHATTVEPHGNVLAIAARIPYEEIRPNPSHEPSLADQHQMSLRSYFHTRANGRVHPQHDCGGDNTPIHVDDSCVVSFSYANDTADMSVAAIWIDGAAVGQHELIEMLEGMVIAIMLVSSHEGFKHDTVDRSSQGPGPGLPVVWGMQSAVRGHECLGLGIIKSVDHDNKQLRIWSPLSQQAILGHGTGKDCSLHLVAQNVDGQGRFSTVWMYEELENKRRGRRGPITEKRVVSDD